MEEVVEGGPEMLGWLSAAQREGSTVVADREALLQGTKDNVSIMCGGIARCDTREHARNTHRPLRLTRGGSMAKPEMSSVLRENWCEYAGRLARLMSTHKF